MQHDPYLDKLTPNVRVHVCASFFQCVKSGHFSNPKKRGKLDLQYNIPILGRSVDETLGHLASKFRDSGRQSPLHYSDDTNRLLPEIRQLTLAWRNTDPSEERQKAITPAHLRFLSEYTSDNKSALYEAMSDLSVGAFFFAMRSCEYLNVDVRGKTKKLVVRNICFYDIAKNELDRKHPDLENLAAYVTITFEDQKNNHKNETRSQQRSGDPVLCPCIRWARIVSRILRYPGATLDSPVNLFVDTTATSLRSRDRLITQESIRTFLRVTAAVMGKKAAGYLPEEIGTHSIRSGAAMALFLADHSTHKIMILGRWSSDAFLAYIRPQVMEWTSGMSLAMTQNNNFFHAPDMLSSSLRANDRSHPDNPHIPGDTRTLTNARHTFSSFNGSSVSSFLMPRLHLFH